MKKYLELSNIVHNFVKNIVMSIIGTISNCIDRIPVDLIQDKIFYAEVDKENYDGIEEEFAKITNDTNYSFKEEKVSDIGKCKVLVYKDYKVVITQSPIKVKLDNFYVAFKTRIV